MSISAAFRGTAQAEYLARLKQARVDESVLLDAIESYARETCSTAAEFDDFIEKMLVTPGRQQCHKAALDVVFSVIAASELPTDEAFRSLVDLLNIAETQGDVRNMKRTFLRTMLENDAIGATVSMATFRNRLHYVEARIEAS